MPLHGASERGGKTLHGTLTIAADGATLTRAFSIRLR